MDFRRIPQVPTAQELIDTAFGRASKVAPPKTAPRTQAKARELARTGTVGKSVAARLNKVVKSFPSVDNLHPFYAELADILVGNDKLRKSLGAVQWARDQTRKLTERSMQDIRANVESTDRMGSIRRGAYGRVASVLKQVDKDLTFLNKARDKLGQVPQLDPEHPTVVIAGYPNVGKSSFIRRITHAEPEIAAYPFTTKGVVLGHLDDRRGRVQFVDTPGLLDRPMEERNAIERQAILALRHVAHTIVFVLDPSETSGYTLAAQEHLMADVRSTFPYVPLLAVENKADFKTTGTRPSMSCETGAGVEGVRDEAVKLARRRHGDLLRAVAEKEIFALQTGGKEEE